MRTRALAILWFSMLRKRASLPERCLRARRALRVARACRSARSRAYLLRTRSVSAPEWWVPSLSVARFFSPRSTPRKLLLGTVGSSSSEALR